MLLYIRELCLEGYYIDVGANIGNHSLFFAVNTPARHVFSFEPSCLAKSIFSEIIRQNGVEERISIVPFAASDAQRSVDFSEVAGAAPRRAYAVRLDDVIPSGAALIKIDVEGSEPAVLRGSVRILTEDRPIVFAEAHDDRALSEIMSVLSPLDYSLSGRVFNPSPTYEIVPLNRSAQ